MYIRNRLEILPIEVSLRWVKGHQKEKGKKMDWWAGQNFRVDLAAKAYPKECRKAKRPFKPIQLKYKETMDEPGYLDAVLAKGADRANEVAEATVADVRDAMGFMERV